MPLNAAGFFAGRWILALAGTLVAGLQAAPELLPLWDGTPPHHVGTAGAETIDAAGTVGNVSVPAIAVHLPPPERATGRAFIVCPGGSYSRVGLFTSGMGTVDYFVPKGTAIIVLKYRTRPPSIKVVEDSLADARRAVRLVRLHAARWKIDPSRVGMIGSSAGAHLVLNLATHWDRGDARSADPVERQSCRPDFICLLCPWPNAQPVADFPVTVETPPAFVASARDDGVAPTEFAEGIAAAYRRAGVECRLWLLEKGGHTAFKLGTNRGEGARWPERFSMWLEEGVVARAGRAVR
jgi:acetyl esterase/lipase